MRIHAIAVPFAMGLLCASALLAVPAAQQAQAQPFHDRERSAYDRDRGYDRGHDRNRGPDRGWAPDRRGQDRDRAGPDRRDQDRGRGSAHDRHDRGRQGQILDQLARHLDARRNQASRHFNDTMRQLGQNREIDNLVRSCGQAPRELVLVANARDAFYRALDGHAARVGQQAAALGARFGIGAASLLQICANSAFDQRDDIAALVNLAALSKAGVGSENRTIAALMATGRGVPENFDLALKYFGN